MKNVVTCPACEGRGSYCKQAQDPVWSELTVQSMTCEMCNGRGQVALADVQEYDFAGRKPYFPYEEFDS